MSTKLDPGYLLRGRWEVIKKLGQGGFGAVYEVDDKQKPGLRAALKTESTKGKNQVLKMEVAVLKKLSSKRHCVDFMGCGRSDQFNFIVMGLVGENLSSIRKKCNRDGRLSAATTIRLGIQAIQSIEDMHSIGFLHRDIKPSNYAMGRSVETQRTLFLLDFGLSRNYTTTTGNLRPPRKSAGFRGTLRYCSVAAHKGIELGRHDDLISVCYMLVEMLRGSLPWRTLGECSAVRKMKETTPVEKLFEKCPPELILVYKHVSRLEYSNRPHYKFYKDLFRKVMVRKGYKDEDPLDWEEGGKGFQFSRQADPPDPDKPPSDQGTKENEDEEDNEDEKTDPKTAEDASAPNENC